MTTEYLARGLVLAMHCVPAEVDPRVEAFWSCLSRSMAERGLVLVLLSTTAVSDSSLQVIDMPFDLRQFVHRFGATNPAGIELSQSAVVDAAGWYRCSEEEAAINLRLARAFMMDLIDTLRPAGVIGWQPLNPLTRLLRLCTLEAELPWWCAERGWVRNTLIFDLGGAHLLGEAHTSLVSARQFDSYQPDPKLLDTLERRAVQADSLGRYAGEERFGRDSLLTKLEIPKEARIAVLFTHGEPGMNAMAADAVREMHDLSREKLQQRVDDLALELVRRGYWLLVQEHPFNTTAGACVTLPQDPRVRLVRENVSSLLDAADVCFFTLATLQFDAVFLGRPFGLLSRSALYRNGDPPFVGDFADMGAFLESVFDASEWPSRFERLRHHVAFIFQHQLLDIEPEAVQTSAQEWAQLVSNQRRPVDTGLDTRVERFLQMWGGR